MLKLRKDVHIPVIVVKDKKGKCSVYVPDLDIVVNGYDYISAISNAIFYVSSIYYYNLNQNVTLKFLKTYQEVEDELHKYPKNAFATLINLTEN